MRSRRLKNLVFADFFNFFPQIVNSRNQTLGDEKFFAKKRVLCVIVRREIAIFVEELRF